MPLRVSRENLVSLCPFPDISDHVCHIWCQSVQPFGSFSRFLNLLPPKPPMCSLRHTWQICFWPTILSRSTCTCVPNLGPIGPQTAACIRLDGYTHTYIPFRNRLCTEDRVLSLFRRSFVITGQMTTLLTPAVRGDALHPFRPPQGSCLKTSCLRS